MMATNSWILAVGVAAFLAADSFAQGTLSSPCPAVADEVAPRGTGMFGPGGGLRSIPVAFVPNEGQWDFPARYVARMGAVTVFLDEEGWWLNFLGPPEDESKAPGASLRMRFVGASISPLLEAEERLPGVHNYFLGNDPARWRAGVARYGAVRFDGLYPGVGARIYEKGGRPEYDLLLEPGASLEGVEVEVEGSDGLRLDGEGGLWIDTAVGPVHQATPNAFARDEAGERSPVACAFEVRGENRFGFTAPEWDGRTALVVDPGIAHWTYLGGSSQDFVTDLQVDDVAVATLLGWTGSANFPTTMGAWDTTYNPGSDVFVSRIDMAAFLTPGLIFSTFLGGSASPASLGLEVPSELFVDGAGRITLTGQTRSPDFPVTPGAWDTTFNGTASFWDIFVSRLDPSLSGAAQLVYSTFLGGTGTEDGRALAVDAAGIVTIGGWMIQSMDYPTTPGAYMTSAGIYWGQAVLSRLDPSLPAASQLVYSTFFGGPVGQTTIIESLAVDLAGQVTMAGTTTTDLFPTTPGAFDSTWNGPGGTGRDGFVSRIDPSLPAAPQLVYSTYLGGSLDEFNIEMYLEPGGRVTVGGTTNSFDFPSTPNAFDTTRDGPADGFVARLDPALSGAAQLLYSTFVGGSSSDWLYALSSDPSGYVNVTGTAGAGFPITAGAFDPVLGMFGGGGDGFVTRLRPAFPPSEQLIYSTFLGDVALHPRTIWQDLGGFLTIGGMSSTWTSAPSLPTLSYDPTYNGGLFDGFLVRFDALPTGVNYCGGSTPGCTGPLVAGVTSIPSVGSANFVFLCTNAPPSVATGLLAVSDSCLPVAIPILGVDVWINLASPILFVLPASSDGTGFSMVPLPIPPSLALVGSQVAGQFFWFGPSSPLPCPGSGFSASMALSVVVQP